jgi:hypothetical protein
MPSAVLVHEPREQAQLAKEGAGVRIVSVESRIDSVSLSAAERHRHGSESRPFDFDVAISESARAEDRLSVRYSYTFGRPSSGQVCRVSGTAAVRFSQFDPSRDFHTLGDDITNEMAVEIFRKNYEAVYLLHEALGMDAPSPWITQEVSLSRTSVSLADGGNP